MRKTRTPGTIGLNMAAPWRGLLWPGPAWRSDGMRRSGLTDTAVWGLWR
ncbi:hypothetical protein ACFVTP_35295 [Streptomyces celluloflavus]